MSAATNTVPWQPCEKAGWPAVQVKHMFETTLGKMLQPQPASDDDIEAPYIKSLHVQWHGVSFDDLPTMWASHLDTEQLEVRVGDLMVCEGGEVGRGALVLSDSPPHCIFQNALHRVRARQSNDVRYLNYCLKQASEAGWFDVLCNRATIAHFTVEKFHELRIHLPSSGTQYHIANYLDRETARIDGLIAEKERMLALLEEKRAALISRVVTRGLYPNAPLKPSGQEWLGEIPAHWEMSRLKYLGETVLGLTFSPDDLVDEGEGVLVLRASNVNSRKIVLEDKIFVRTDIPPVLRTKPLDILICSRSGSRALIGKNALITEETSDLTFGAFMTVYRSNLNQFLFWVFNSKLFEFQAGAFGTSTINQLTTETLANMEVPVPPRDERDAIAAHLQETSIQFDSAISAVSQSIDLAKERRAALITAAVTGQITLKEKHL